MTTPLSEHNETVRQLAVAFVETAKEQRFDVAAEAALFMLVMLCGHAKNPNFDQFVLSKMGVVADALADTDE